MRGSRIDESLDTAGGLGGGGTLSLSLFLSLVNTSINILSISPMASLSAPRFHLSMTAYCVINMD